MIDFGTGPTLREANPHLRDAAERRAQILDVAERNSVIEGLPPFDDETRARMLAALIAAEQTGVGQAFQPAIQEP